MKPAPVMSTNPVSRLVADWQATWRQLIEEEKAAHPPITDDLGREWEWWQGDIYRHCHSAFPRDVILSGRLDTLSPSTATNPNYADACDICTRHWPKEPS